MIAFFLRYARFLYKQLSMKQITITPIHLFTRDVCPEIGWYGNHRDGLIACLVSYNMRPMKYIPIIAMTS